MNARPELTVTMGARGCFFSVGKSAGGRRGGPARVVGVRGRGPSRLVVMMDSAVASASASSSGESAARFSFFMMPALLMRTLREGKSAATFAAKALMAAGALMFGVRDLMPG